MQSDTVDECICYNTPLSRAGIYLSPEGAKLGHFHMDCPIHGVVVVSMVPITEEEMENKVDEKNV